MYNNNKLCQQYLKILYQDVKTHHADDLTETHGEILYESVNKLLSKIAPTQDDIFIDFGSGLGKIVTQLFLNSNVKKAYGIELIPGLHQQASFAAKKLQQDLPEFFQHNRELTFLSGNFLEMDLPPATIALINGVCFSQPLLLGLADIINKMTSIHTVLATRPLLTLKRLKLKKIIRVQCSWDTALCYLYK